MKLTLPLRRDWFPRFPAFHKPRRAEVLPNATGQTVALRYPRFDQNTLGALEAYFQSHGQGQYTRLVIVHTLPTGRTLKRLRTICRTYGAALMEMPARSTEAR